MKHALKGLDLLKEDLLKEHDRIMGVKGTGLLSAAEADRITTKISVKLFEINQEIKVISNL
jgi:hypothetical protein